jgi:hypothetical protein
MRAREHWRPDTLRRGDVSKGLLITLGILVVLAAGYWIWHFATRETVTGKPGAAEQLYVVTCTNEQCKANTKMTAEEVKALPYAPDNSLKCPKCGEFTAHVNREKGGSVLTPEGG